MSNNKDLNFYYKFVLKTFGHADLLGCRALANLLYLYKPGDMIADICETYANSISSTSTAVARCVNRYIKEFMKEITMEELSTMLDYSFKANQTTVSASELIPVLKLALESEE